MSLLGGLFALAIVALPLCTASDSYPQETCADDFSALQVSMENGATSSPSKTRNRPVLDGFVKSRFESLSTRRQASAAGDHDMMNCSQATGILGGSHCLDANGRKCFFCGHPSPQFPEYGEGYIHRTDCGNASDDHDEDRPVVTYTRPPSHNFLPSKGAPPTGWTNAWCELNNQVASVNAEANHDYFFFVTTFVAPPGLEWDFYYCKSNGYLEEAFVKNMRNYDALYEQSAAVCAARDAEFNISSITMRQVNEIFDPLGRPTPEQGRFIAAWTCAMGGPGPDISYCAYTYRDLGDGKFCFYPNAPGWKGTIFEGTALARRWQCPNDHEDRLGTR